ncbi:caspase-1-like [Bombus pascuorum]|uniref:caspase-1-like n=1 Tax=Bombus pascuorum TaxID=65598 RepID=UPI002137F529|nr:caspase-1-like [Bombus pascuorum]
MFVLIFCFISLSRAAINYISNITKMKSLAHSSRDQPISQDPTKENCSKDSKENLDLTDAKVVHGISYRKEIVQNFPVDKDAEVYPMNNRRRGKCVIFNNENFIEMKKRDGTKNDQKAIEKTFTNLGFEVKSHLDLDYVGVMDEAANLSANDYEDYDCICIFILSHGTNGDNVYAKDYPYRLSDIWGRFTADNCPSLTGKPKLFFIQACKGESTMLGIRVKSATDSVQKSYTIPTHADFLYGYSCIEGHYSFRTSQGSYYIQTLCEVINKHWRNMDLLKMLTITSRKVAFEFEAAHNSPLLNETKQMPTFSSTLTRDLYFFPKNKS